MIVTRVHNGVRYVRENWREIFAVFVSEGECRPRFFLPTHRSHMRHGYVCWIFPLAFVVIIYRALHAGFFSLWRDLMDAVALMHEKV